MFKKLLIGGAAIAASAIAIRQYPGLMTGSDMTSSTIIEKRHARKEITSPDVARIPEDATICVNTVLDTRETTREKKSALAGLDQELIAQLNDAGFKAGPASDTPYCHATVYTELTAIDGRKTPKARLDFRLSIAGEQKPRLLSSATGTSADGQPKFAGATSFNPRDTDRAKFERDAVAAAFAAEASRIRTAQRDGMPAYRGE